MIDATLRKQIAGIARELNSLGRRVRAVERTAQGRFRSITDGATTYYDEFGQPRVVVGPQDDGSFTHVDLNGPVPPTPTQPVLVPGPGTLEIIWDGKSIDGANWPADFSHIEVHVNTSYSDPASDPYTESYDDAYTGSTTQNAPYTPVDATQIASFHSTRGGRITIIRDVGTQYVIFVAVSSSGVESAPSLIQSGSAGPVLNLSDGVAPLTAPGLTFIGGIGSVFFRWNEVENADPVTYRLHVRAGSAPTTDGTYEVASGVGLTAAVVRKLKDGTSVVADGTVVYFGIVTVEDADGVGPPSDTASGIPAQVTTSDISANVVTTDFLLSNSAFIGALQSTDFTSVSMTGVQIQTQAASNRGVKLGKFGDNEGFWVYDDQGNPFLSAEPASGMAVVAGEVKASTLTVRDKSSIGGRTEITRATDGSAGELALTAYTTAPGSAPTATQSHDFVQFTDDGKWGSRTGWTFDGTYYYTFNIVTDVLEKWSESGTLVASSVPGAFGDAINHDIVYTKNDTGFLAYINPVSPSQILIRKWTASTLAAGPTYTTGTDLSGTRDVGLGWDSTGSGGVGDLIIAQSRASNSDKIRFTRWRWDTLATVSSSDTNTGYAKGLRGVYFGAADFGANRYVTKSALGQDAFKVYNTGTPNTEQTGESWPTGLNSGVTSPGFVWHAASGVFKSMDSSGKLRTHTGIWSATSANMTKWVSNTLALTSRTAVIGTTSASTNVTFTGTSLVAGDIGSIISGTGIPAGTTVTAVDSVAGTATLSAAATATNAALTATIVREVETDQSPRSKIVMSNRYKLNVTASLINSGGTNAPDRTYFYIGNGTTDPGRAQMARQTSPAPSTTPPSMSYSSPLVAPPGTFQPPATNGFIALGGTVQRLVLADGTVFLDGRGGGSWATKTQTGSALYSAASITGGAWNAFTVLFPTPFPTAPIVVPSYTPGSLPASSIEVRVAAGSVTTTGFTLYIWRNTSLATTVSWNASL